jgi:uncharacterized protein
VRNLRYAFPVYNLTDIEARVLGALVEKELTTPDYYPLSMNALVNACNQKSNRDPHMNLTEANVDHAMRSLEKQGLAGRADSDGRVTKYEHRLQEAFNFDRRDVAILCELLLRGPQTPGELRSRASRMHPFEDLAQIQSALQRLAQREPPLVTMLARQTGMKEARYAHLMSGPVTGQGVEPRAAEASAPSDARSRSADDSFEMAALQSEIAELKSDVADLKNEIADVKSQLASFRKQFE